LLYRELRPSIGICLLDVIELRSAAALHHHFQLQTASGLLLTDLLAGSPLRVAQGRAAER